MSGKDNYNFNLFDTTDNEEELKFVYDPKEEEYYANPLDLLVIEDDEELEFVYTPDDEYPDIVNELADAEDEESLRGNEGELESVNPIIEQPKELTLDDVVTIINKYVTHTNIDYSTALRHELVEIGIKERLSISDNVLWFFSQDDVSYKQLLVNLIPQTDKAIAEVDKIKKDIKEPFTEQSLVNALAKATIFMLWSDIEDKMKDNAQDQIPNLFMNINGKLNFYPKSEDKGITQFIARVTKDYREIGHNISKVLNDTWLLYEGLEDVTKKALPKASAEKSDTIKDKETPNPEVTSSTLRVLKVYKDLFEGGFDLQTPYGILTKDGLIRLQDNGQIEREEVSSLAKIYQILSELSGKFLVQSESESGEVNNFRGFNIRKGTTYYPEFQLGNLHGFIGNIRYKSWNEFERHLKEKVYQSIQINLEEGKEPASIVDTLTTCIVISEFDPEVSLKLRINLGNNLISDKQLESEYFKKKSSIFAGTGELFHIAQLPTGVIELTLVFDRVAFNDRPLFAYEAVNKLHARGERPSIEKVILGYDTSDKILTTNLNKQNASIILIGAGQRSGKGVLTLNMLGNILAEGCPLIYLDGKPDMAPVLWDLGNKYRIKPAVWDVFEHNENIIGVGAPEAIQRENPGIFGVLVYLKALQLMMVAASLQAKGQDFNTKRPFFIFDEALAVQSMLSTNWQRVISGAKNKSKLEDDISDIEWCKTIVNWCEGLASSLTAVINSQLPKSGISTVWLFQSMQPNSWSQFDTQGLSGKFNILKAPIMSRLSVKLLGRGTVDSEYGLSAIKNNPLITQRVSSEGGRHFALTTNQKVTDIKDVTVFKPYLVLNTYENGTPAVEELRKNVSFEVWSKIAPNGELQPEAGFEGFARLIGEDAVKNLVLGRAYLEAVLKATPFGSKYNNIDEYLYDASADSFKSLGTLVRGYEEPAKDTDSNYSSINWGSPDLKELDNTFELFNEKQPKQSKEPIVVKGNKQFGSNQPLNYVNKSVLSNQRMNNQPITHHNENAKREYTGKITMKHNPFDAYGSSVKPVSVLNVVRETSKALLDEIISYFGDLSLVNSISIKSSGLLIINNIPFKPQFDDEVLELMPVYLRESVSDGYVIDLFHFKYLKKFKNLISLELQDTLLAEGRLRREMGIGRKASWSILFKKMKSLKKLVIGKSVITDEVTAKDYVKKGKGGYTEEAFAKIPTYMAKMWNTKPAKIATSALGYSLGAKTLWTIAIIGGPWGLLFSALAGTMVISDAKNRYFNNQSLKRGMNIFNQKQQNRKPTKRPSRK